MASRFTKMFRGGGSWAKAGGALLGGPLGYTTMQNGGLSGWNDDTSKSMVRRLTAPLNTLFDETGVNDIKAYAERGYGALAPFIAGGHSALGELLRLEKDPSSIAQTGQYKFRLNEGTNAITRKAAAAGFSGSGNVLYELLNYGQAAASQEYDNRWKQLMSLVDAGNRAAGSTAQLSSDTGRTISSHNVAQTQNALQHRGQITDEIYTWLGFGMGGGMGGGGGLGGMFCWVAMEVFGPTNYKTLFLRKYLVSKLHAKGPMGMFARFYKRNGEAWAAKARTNKVIRMLSKAILNIVYKIAGGD